MRETFSSLKTQAHNYTQTQSTDTAVATFLASELNRAYRFVLSELINYKTQITYTAYTASGQQYYHFPAAQVMLETAVITISSVRYNLTVLDSPQKWEDFNAVQFVGLAIPQFIFPRRDDFGIYPKPQGVYQLDLTFSPRYTDMANTDYTTGTAAVTNASASVTGSGSAWTTAMAGRWFKYDTDGKWYRISSVSSTTVLTLENYFEGTTASGGTYIIGESPEIPEETHELLPYRAAAMYFAGMRSDINKSTWWNNMFWTGDGANSRRDLENIRSGLLGAMNRYSSRSDSGVIQRNVKRFDDWATKVWASQLS